jgi:hypothetical protein
MDIKTIEDLYLSGKCGAEISRLLGIERHLIMKTLREHGTSIRGNHSLSKQDELEVCRLYTSGISSIKLRNQFKTAPSTIINILKRHNITRRGYIIYPIKHENYFDAVDSEHKAYWLGFIAADGCLVDKCRRLDIVLQSSDENHLKVFLDDIGNERPIYRRTVKNKYESSGIAIFSPVLTSGLIAHGITERKSLTLQWPSLLPKNLENHYIRGYVDGDGGFYIGTNKYKKNPNISFSVTCGSIQFLTMLRDHLATACNLPKPALIRRKDKPDNSQMLVYCGRLQIGKIFSYLYENATIWLHRKYDKIVPYL